MVIRIYAHQKYGEKTEKCVDDYEFCCWESLYEWLSKFKGLNKCEVCKRSESVKEEKYYG